MEPVKAVEEAIRAECERQMDCDRGDEVHDHWGDIARAALDGLRAAGYDIRHRVKVIEDPA